ncbi:MAG TPA: hypothetical protein VFC82_03975 [Actinomycetaceae bacterium]|nr:hypothetical protein [Actinomycetaceae bacterium]
MRYHAIPVIAAMLWALGLSGCSGGDDIPTCREFAEMEPNTGLLVPFNAKQVDAMKAALRVEGFDEGSFNQGIARGEILSYCNIYDGVASNNPDQPITLAVRE